MSSHPLMSYTDHPSVFSSFHSPEISKARELRPGRWAALVSAGLAAMTLSSCDHKEAHHEAEEEEESQLVLTKPIIRDTTISRDYVCQIRSCRNIEIRALERGYLEVVSVKEGQLVKEGDLVSLDGSTGEVFLGALEVFDEGARLGLR